jgi:hypothetical protein
MVAEAADSHIGLKIQSLHGRLMAAARNTVTQMQR